MHFHTLFSNIISISSSFLFFFFVLFKIVKRWNRNDSTMNLPPGPTTLPFIGNIHQVISNSLPHHQLKKLANKYGPLMHLKIGEVPYIIVSSSEMAKEIMKTHDINFSDRPNLFLPTIWSYNATDIVFSKYGEHWRQLRKICVLELLSAKRVQSFRSIREEEVANLVKSISRSEGSIVNITQKILSLMNEITTHATFGGKIRNQQLFLSTLDEIVILLGGISTVDLYPSFKILQMLSMSKTKMEKLHNETNMIIQDMIDYHKTFQKEPNKDDDDLVDVLLNIQRNDHSLTDDKIKAVIQDMFAGGSETSSNIVLWGMSEMINNPKVMEDAQAEVRRLFDRKGYVDENELHQLIYLKSIIKETMRLHPPIPVLVPRQSIERCQINGYDIPAKTRVIVNVWAIGRDPKNWVEAESFKPERFLINSTIDFKGKDFEYIPFGAGRRMCPGIAFGLANIELPLANLLYHFDWKLPNEKLDMSEKFGITVGRKHDLSLIPIMRRP